MTGSGYPSYVWRDDVHADFYRELRSARCVVELRDEEDGWLRISWATNGIRWQMIKKATGKNPFLARGIRIYAKKPEPADA